MGYSRTPNLLLLITSLLLLILATPILAAERGSAADFYVSEFWHDRVIQFDGATGARVGVFAELTYQHRALLDGLAFGGQNNNLFVVPENYPFIAEFDGNTGAPVRHLPLRPSPPHPTGIVVGPNGNLFVAFHYSGGAAVDEYDSQTGDFVGTFVENFKGIYKNGRFS